MGLRLGNGGILGIRLSCKLLPYLCIQLMILDGADSSI